MKIKLYLAHPFDNRKELREWELGFEKRTGINLVNPFYDTERKDVEIIDLGIVGRYEKLIPKEIVERDLDIIKNCNGVVGFITGSISYGTIMEITYNYLLLSLHGTHPNYLIITNGHENHPWLKHHATKIFTSKEDFETWIINKNNMEKKNE